MPIDDYGKLKVPSHDNVKETEMRNFLRQIFVFFTNRQTTKCNYYCFTQINAVLFVH